MSAATKARPTAAGRGTATGPGRRAAAIVSTALHDHETHLADGRPGKRGLDRRLGEHDKPAEQSGEPAYHDQHSEHPRREQHDIREADQEEPAGVDHPGMEQCGNRGRRFHHLGQPAMQRKLRGLEQRSDGEKACGSHRQGTAHSGSRRAQYFADIRCTIGQVEQQRGADERGLAGARGHELLARGALRGSRNARCVTYVMTLCDAVCCRALRRAAL